MYDDGKTRLSLELDSFTHFLLVDFGVGVFSAQFGCLSWSRREDKLLYVAERIRNVSGERPHPQPDCQKVLKHTHTQTHKLVILFF